ncbi:hypothetical protein ScPMuIL_014501 [Solemya velum]
MLPKNLSPPSENRPVGEVICLNPIAGHHASDDRKALQGERVVTFLSTHRGVHAYICIVFVSYIHIDKYLAALCFPTATRCERIKLKVGFPWCETDSPCPLNVYRTVIDWAEPLAIATHGVDSGQLLALVTACHSDPRCESAEITVLMNSPTRCQGENRAGHNKEEPSTHKVLSLGDLYWHVSSSDGITVTLK